MKKNEIANSITNMIIENNTDPNTSAIDCYNKWVKKNGVIIDPDTAHWTLQVIHKLLFTDRDYLKTFLSK